MNFPNASWLISFLIGALLTPTARAQDEYAFILRARGNPYWNVVKQGIQETAKASGISVVVYEGESDKASEEQLNICFSAIERRPKFLAIAAANASIGIQCLKRAVEKGISIGEIDGQIPLEDAAKQGLKIPFSVGSDNFEIGREAAKYAASAIASAEPKVFVLEGAAGAVAGTQRVKGFRDELGTLLPRASIVASISADWDRLKAMNATMDILQRNPSLDLIYAANDMMALGAVEAVKSQKRAGTVKVIGVDGTADARRAVVSGAMTATVAQLPYLIGKRVVELGVQSVKGETVPQVERTETPVLHRDALEKNNFPYSEYLR